MAIRFDANGESVSLSSGVLDYNAAYTLMAWVRLRINSAYHGIFNVTVGASSTNRDQVYIHGNNTLRLAVGNGGAAGDTTSPETLVDGTWRHIAIVRASLTSAALYLDGAQTGSTVTQTASGRSPATLLTLGGNPWNASEHLDGCLAHAKIWTAALSQGDIAAEMASATPVKTGGLWAYYPLNTHTDLNDYSGNDRHLTASGTLSTEDSPTFGGDDGDNPYISLWYRHLAPFMEV